jgi:hypothetical protein
LVVEAEAVVLQAMLPLLVLVKLAIAIHQAILLLLAVVAVIRLRL